MATETDAGSDGLGIWIRIWDVLAAFALLAASFLWVRLEAIPHMLSLAADRGHFTGKALLLDTYRHGYGFETARDHLRALGDEGRAFYGHSFLPVYDLANSLFLLTFSVLFILYATQSAKGHALEIPSLARKAMLVPPVVQFLCDVGENFSLRSLMDEYPRINAKLVETASQFTQFKWFAIFATTLIMIGLAAFTLYRMLAPVSQGGTRG